MDNIWLNRINAKKAIIEHKNKSTEFTKHTVHQGYIEIHKKAVVLYGLEFYVDYIFNAFELPKGSKRISSELNCENTLDCDDNFCYIDVVKIHYVLVDKVQYDILPAK